MIGDNENRVARTLDTAQTYLFSNVRALRKSTRYFTSSGTATHSRAITISWFVEAIRIRIGDSFEDTSMMLRSTVKGL